MQTGILVIPNFTVKPKITENLCQISLEVDPIFRVLEKKLRLTPDKRNAIKELIQQYRNVDAAYSIPISELLAIALYRVFPFVTYQLICAWIGIKQSDFVKAQKSIARLSKKIN